MYYKNIDSVRFTAAHAQGLLDGELAREFGVSLSTVKRRRTELNLSSNCPHNNRGRLGERLVGHWLSLEGLHVEPKPSPSSPYDLRVNGWRVEVKVGQRRSEQDAAFPSYQFRLPEQRGSHYGQYVYSKDYPQDTDFLALAVVEEDRLAQLYLLPSHLWQASITVTPGSLGCRFQGYVNAIGLLQDAKPSSAA